MASALTGDQTVTLFPAVAGTDGDGNPTRVPSEVGVGWSCRVHPVSSEEAADLGQALRTVYRAIGRDCPAGAFARASWDGRLWDVLGEPKRWSGSAAVRHDVVVLAARGPEAVS